MSVYKISGFDLNVVDKTVIFILDTNILYFVHSGYYTSTNNKYIAYSNLLQQIISKGNTLLVTSLNLQEFIFGIENKEYELHLSNTGKMRKGYTKKHFRKDVALRAGVHAKLKTVLAEVKAVYELCDIEVPMASIEDFVSDFLKYYYDPMDYLMVNATNKKDVIYITDDTDFHSDSRIEVLTM